VEREKGFLRTETGSAQGAPNGKGKQRLAGFIRIHIKTKNQGIAAQLSY